MSKCIIWRMYFYFSKLVSISMDWLGYNDVVNTLLMKSANVNVQEPTSGNTPLHIASEKGYWSYIRIFYIYSTFMSLFNWSCTGFKKIVKYLIDHHADVNIINKNGNSSLYIALKRGNQITLLSFNK